MSSRWSEAADADTDVRALTALLREQWGVLRERLQHKQLLGGELPTLTLRIPGSAAMWHGSTRAAEPELVDSVCAPQGQALPPAAAAAVLARRTDVCAVLHGGGVFGQLLAASQPADRPMPLVFDEQVRHLGRMPATRGRDWAAGLGQGGNVLLLDGQPLVLGMTAQRLALNAELFEKCAKAYVLAAATGGRIRPLPWIVRHVANGRLMKDEARARARVTAGLLPLESQGY